MSVTARFRRPARLRSLSVAGVCAVAAAATAVTLAPSPAHAAEPAKSASAAQADEVAKIIKQDQKKYPQNLDGWIRTGLDVMHAKGIPGSYNGLYRNIIRESAGNPNAVNNWDINAQNGVPSKGLLQVIAPTFATYHVQGTKYNLTDPVSNIVAAANYAAARYGSIDNVNSAY